VVFFFDLYIAFIASGMEEAWQNVKFAMRY
jgi:hypothetical protein